MVPKKIKFLRFFFKFYNSIFFSAERIVTVYENAVKKEPTNEEFLTHLFMSHVRLGNYKRQQQIATALYKAKPKTPYYFWAVMSVVLQATTSGDKISDLSKM